MAVIRRIAFALAAGSALLTGCAAPAAAGPGSMPNMYQRAKVLSKDDVSIRIEHSARLSPPAWQTSIAPR
jgi:hypothetical protein